MIGEINSGGVNNSFVVAVGFGYDATEAGHHAWQASQMDLRCQKTLYRRIDGMAKLTNSARRIKR